MLKAVHAIHEENIIHSDLKPAVCIILLFCNIIFFFFFCY